MPDNEEPSPDATTELPPVEPVTAAAPVQPVAVAPAYAAPPVAVAPAAPTTHSTTRVVLAAVAGAVVVFLIAASGIIGYAIGSHHSSNNGPGRIAQLTRGLDGGMSQQLPGRGFDHRWQGAPDTSQGQGTAPTLPNPQGGQGNGPGLSGRQGQAPGQSGPWSSQ